MNTGIAQLVALSAHGMAALHELHGGEDLGSTSLFRYVNTLTFTADPALGMAESSTPSNWFARLRAHGARAMRFVRLSTDEGALERHVRVAFANGEQAATAVVYADRRMELWVPEWRSTPGEEGWTLVYHGRDGGTWQDAWMGAPVPEARLRLERVLREIAAFASDQGLDSWVDNFDDARALLSARTVATMGLLPERGYAPEARRLLAGALASWVFGGMGSWNDTGPRDNEQYPRYEALSAELYDALMDALVSATNAFDAEAR